MWPAPQPHSPRFITGQPQRRQAGDPVPKALRQALEALHLEVRAVRAEIGDLRRREVGPAVTIERACELLQCSRTKLHELIGDGTLERAPKHGKKVQLTTASVYRALEHGQQAQAQVKRIRSRTNPSLDSELDAITVR